MPHVIVTSAPPQADAPVTLDEEVAAVHVGDKYALKQLSERIAWAVQDAERAEALGPPAQGQGRTL
jgi:hypothetical protein